MYPGNSARHAGLYVDHELRRHVANELVRIVLEAVSVGDVAVHECSARWQVADNDTGRTWCARCLGAAMAGFVSRPEHIPIENLLHLPLVILQQPVTVVAEFALPAAVVDQRTGVDEVGAQCDDVVLFSC